MPVARLCVANFFCAQNPNQHVTATVRAGGSNKFVEVLIKKIFLPKFDALLVREGHVAEIIRQRVVKRVQDKIFVRVAETVLEQKNRRGKNRRVDFFLRVVAKCAARLKIIAQGTIEIHGHFVRHMVARDGLAAVNRFAELNVTEYAQ